MTTQSTWPGRLRSWMPPVRTASGEVASCIMRLLRSAIYLHPFPPFFFEGDRRALDFSHILFIPPESSHFSLVHYNAAQFLHLSLVIPCFTLQRLAPVRFGNDLDPCSSCPVKHATNTARSASHLGAARQGTIEDASETPTKPYAELRPSLLRT